MSMEKLYFYFFLPYRKRLLFWFSTCLGCIVTVGGSVAEWLACWTQAQKGPGSNRSRDAVFGELFTPIVPLFTKQQN